MGLCENKVPPKSGLSDHFHHLSIIFFLKKVAITWKNLPFSPSLGLSCDHVRSLKQGARLWKSMEHGMWNVNPTTLKPGWI
jgi:hypothetical protein